MQLDLNINNCVFSNSIVVSSSTKVVDYIIFFGSEVDLFLNTISLKQRNEMDYKELTKSIISIKNKENTHEKKESNIPDGIVNTNIDRNNELKLAQNEISNNDLPNLYGSKYEKMYEGKYEDKYDKYDSKYDTKYDTTKYERYDKTDKTDKVEKYEKHDKYEKTDKEEPYKYESKFERGDWYGQ